MKSTQVEDKLDALRQRVAYLESECKKLGDALLHSEALYQSLLESVTDYVYTVEVIDGRAINTIHRPGCVAVTGYTPEDYAADPYLWYRMVPEVDTPAVVWQAAQVLNGEPALSLEHRIVHKDGSMRWVRNTPVAHYDAQGSMVAYDGLVTDITERKQAEEALRESEELYRRMADNIQDGLAIIEDGHVVYVNDRACEIFGYPKSEFVEMDGLDFAAPEEKDRLRQFMEEGRRVDRPVFPSNLEYWILRKDGSRRCVHNRYSYNRRPDGGISRFVVTTDITERKLAEEARLRELQAVARAQAAEAARRELEKEIAERLQVESALRESQRFIQRIIDTIPVPVFYKDTQGLYLGCNVAFERFIGFSRDKIVGKSVYDTSPPHLAWVYHEADMLLLSQPGTQVYEASVRYADGSLREVIFNKATFAAPDGTVGGLVGTILDISDNKRVENALRESEARYRSLVEQIPAITYTAALDEASTTLYVSPQSEKLLGYSKQDYDADPDLWRKALHPEDCERVLNELLQTHADRVPFASEYRMIQRNGSVIWIHDEAIVVYDPSGRPLVLQGIMFDYTERKRADEALKRRAAQLALLNDIGQKIVAALALDVVLDTATRLVHESFDYHHVGIFVIDDEHQEAVLQAWAGAYAAYLHKGHYLKLNEGMVGWTATHAVMRLSNDVLTDPQYVPSFGVTQAELCVPIRIGDKMIGVLDAQSPQRDEFDESDVLVMETLAGQIAIAIENARLFEQAQREISERKQAEEALRRRNEELTAYNAIATTIGQALDLGHVLMSTLRMTLEMIGIDAGWIQLLDQEGKTLDLAAQCGLSDEMADEMQSIPVSQCITGEVAESGQPIILDKVSDDPRLCLESARREELHTFAAVPAKSKDKVLGVLGVFSRSPRGLSSHEIQLLIAIGHQIGVAIENKQLAQMASEVKVLQELDRLRSELIANVSHELRTPLGLIKVFCTTLLREDAVFDRATQLEFLEDIRQETDNLQALVDNLLDVARLQNGSLRLERRPTDVGGLVNKVMRAMEVELGPQHHFVYDFPPEPLLAYIDARRVEEVLRNLLSNAIKYSPDGGPITIHGHLEKGHVLVHVRDCGIGIHPDDLHNVFERFYRVENEATQDIGGVGLGLAVCQGIVESHRGRIWVESTPGVGSTFYFTLPVYNPPPTGASLEVMGAGKESL